MDSISVNNFQGLTTSGPASPAAGEQRENSLPQQELSQADSVVSGNKVKTRAVLPENLSLPPKKWSLPLPNLKTLATAFMLQAISTMGGVFSASAAGSNEEAMITPEQTKDIKQNLKPGDIILSRTPANQLYYIMQKAAFGSAYSHAAMYAGDDRVIDAYEEVKEQSIEDFCTKQTAVVILRPQYTSEKERQQALKYLDEQVGKPYDWRFDLKDDSAHYCTEIIVRALEAANPRQEVQGRWYMGKPVVVPDDFLHSSFLKPVQEFCAD